MAKRPVRKPPTLNNKAPSKGAVPETRAKDDSNKTKRVMKAKNSATLFKTQFPLAMLEALSAVSRRMAIMTTEDQAEKFTDLVVKNAVTNGGGEPMMALGQPFSNHTALMEKFYTMYSYIHRSLKTSAMLRSSLKMLAKTEDFVFTLFDGKVSMSVLNQEAPAAEMAMKTGQHFAPIIDWLRQAGFDANAPVSLLDFARQSQFDESTSAVIRSLKDRVSMSSFSAAKMSSKTEELLETGLLDIRIITDVEITATEFVLNIYLKISIDKMLYPHIVVQQDERLSKEAAILYVNMWVTNAVTALVNFSPRRWKGTPVIDLRSVSSRIRSSKQNFGSVAARVNANGFASSGGMTPLYIKEEDNCDAFVDSLTKNVEVDEKGVYNFSDGFARWANKVLLVDWFNDYVLYAKADGDIGIFRMPSVRPLDPSTEMAFLRTPIDEIPGSKELFTKILNPIAGANVTPTDAQKYMDKALMSKLLPDEGQLQRVMDSTIGTLFGDLVAKLNRNNRDARYFSSSTMPSVGMLLGILTEEEHSDERTVNVLTATALAYRAHLRALADVWKDIEHITVVERMQCEYFMWAAKEYPDANHPNFLALRTKDRDNLNRLNVKHQFGDEVDVPNLEIGANSISGVMPHQVAGLSHNLKSATSVYSVATGGGKTIFELLDILLSMFHEGIKRPLVLTKPGLVKDAITELNKISKGKVNAVPLRTTMLRHLRNKAGLKTAKDFLNWARNLPANTVFFASYTDLATQSITFEDLEVPGQALWFDVALSQTIHLLRLIGIDMVFGDESHQIKNISSRRSICSYSAFASAKKVRIGSGTLTPNTARDLVGQFIPINPMVFGDDPDFFADRFGIVGGLLKNDDAAAKINLRMREMAKVFVADEEDWSYVLPTFDDKIITSTMTPMQEAFYNKLMMAAQLEMRAALLKKGIGVDGEDDDETDVEGDDDEEKEDARIIAAATTSLQRVEQFLIAPDRNEEYLAWEQNPTGKDLVSTVVPLIDKYITTKFAGIPEGQRAENKVIIFSWHIAGVDHIAQHSMYKDKFIVYKAGDVEAVRKFKADPSKLILLAAEGSLREGENLQMASTIIRCQPVWSPGDDKQAAARAYRPDPRGKYAFRDVVEHVRVLVEGAHDRPSYSTVKLAYMASKAISNARLRYEGDIDWRRVAPAFEDLKRLRMKLEILFETQRDDIQPYLDAWKTFNKWIAERVSRARVRHAQELEQEHKVKLIENGKIIDMTTFLRLSLKPLVSTKDLPGSKYGVYVPWVSGAVPADVYDLGLVVLGGQDIVPGSPVMTEFGAGLVESFSERSVTINLYGDKKVTLQRLRVAIPADPAGTKKLKGIIGDKTKWRSTYRSPKVSGDGKNSVKQITESPNVKVPSNLTAKPPVDGAKPRVQKRDLVKEEVNDVVDIFPNIVNGWPMLTVFADEAPPALAKQPGWHKVDAYYFVRFRTWDIADKFLDIMAEKFYINASHFDKLVEEMENMREGKVMRSLQRFKESSLRSFFMEQRRRLGKSKDNRYMIKPYWVVVGDEVRLAFDADSHASQVRSWLVRATAKVKGMLPIKDIDALVVYPFKTSAEAKEGLIAAGKILSYDKETLQEEFTQLKEELKSYSVRKARPRA